MYFVVHVEARYIGAFGVLFWLALFCGLRLRNDARSERWMRYVTFGGAVTMLAGTAVWVVRDALRGEEFPTFDGILQCQYADQLQRLGVGPGEKVATMGSALGAARWARLARVQIVAETPWTEMIKFWQADDAVKAQVVETLAPTGVNAIVAEQAPVNFSANGWHRIGTTNYFVYVFGK